MVYEYTKPRGPIAAMYSSPGPCYALPGLIGQKTHDPRSEHKKGPSYPFGTRHGKFKDDCSPGPCYNPCPRMSRRGPDGTPHYSLYSRQKDVLPFRAPGPGAYSPEHAGKSAHFNPPAYLFGIRHKYRKSDQTPGPNSYMLPLMIGKTAQSGKKQAPCFSMTGRSQVGSFCEDHFKTPGPGTYAVTNPTMYKNKGPNYSMTSRNQMPGDTTLKPGPGAHSPENVHANKPLHPRYSFGIRHSQYEAPLIVQAAD